MRGLHTAVCWFSCVVMPEVCAGLGNCHGRLRIEIFVRVLHSSEVISLIICK